MIATDSTLITEAGILIPMQAIQLTNRSEKFSVATALLSKLTSVIPT